MKIHIWIDKKDVSKLASGEFKIDFWYRKPSFPNKKKIETVMISISPDTFQSLLDNEIEEDHTDDIQVEAGFGD